MRPTDGRADGPGSPARGTTATVAHESRCFWEWSLLDLARGREVIGAAPRRKGEGDDRSLGAASEALGVLPAIHPWIQVAKRDFA
jgi:hypothetical protein